MTNARLEQTVERVFYIGLAILCGVSIGVCNDQRAQRVRAQADFAGLVADIEKNAEINPSFEWSDFDGGKRPDTREGREGR